MHISQTEEHEGVSAVTQWVKNPTSIHEDEGLIPGLVQWVKDPVLSQAAVCRSQVIMGPLTFSAETSRIG